MSSKSAYAQPRPTASDCRPIHSKIIRQVQSQMLTGAQLAELAGFFQLFSDSSRVKILWALKNHEMCVCDLAVLLQMTKSAISHKLKLLRAAKLIKSRKTGRHIFYSLDDEHVHALIGLAREHLSE